MVAMRYDALGAVSRSSASRYGIFTRSEATSAGLDRGTISRLLHDGILREPHPRVLAWAAAAPTWEQDLAAAQLAFGGTGVVSHRAASRLHRLDGFAEEPALELLARRRLRIVGVECHRTSTLPSEDLVDLDGFRVTGLARTLCDLGSVVDPDRVERALDSARRRGMSLRWLESTARRLHRPGQTGTGVVLGLLADIRDDPALRDSWFERTVELLMSHPRLAGLGWDTLYLGYQSTRRPAATRDLVARVVEARAALLRGADDSRGSRS